MGRLPCDPGVTTALLGRRFRGCNRRDTFVQQTDPPMHRVLALCSAVLFTVLQGSAQCLIGNANAPGSDPTDVEIGQSFMPTCNGELTYVEIYRNEGGTNVAGQLRIYAGSTVTSTPVHSQAVPATVVEAGSYLRIDLTTPVPAVAFQSLTFELPMSLEIPFSGGNPYPGGRMFYNGTNAALYANSDIRFNANIASNCTNTSASFLTIACQEYTAPSGAVYTTSGIFNDTIPNAQGCDSLLTIAVDLTSVDTSVAVAGAVLTVGEAEASYQWVDCATGEAISGADAQSFEPAGAGSYAVDVTVGICTVRSACVVLLPTAIGARATPLLTLRPHAQSGLWMIDGVAPTARMMVLDGAGRPVQYRWVNGVLDLTTATDGVYVVQVLEAEGASHSGRITVVNSAR